jgi:hypothetical protein
LECHVTLPWGSCPCNGGMIPRFDRAVWATSRLEGPPSLCVSSGGIGTRPRSMLAAGQANCTGFIPASACRSPCSPIVTRSASRPRSLTRCRCCSATRCRSEQLGLGSYRISRRRWRVMRARLAARRPSAFRLTSSGRTSASIGGLVSAWSSAATQQRASLAPAIAQDTTSIRLDSIVAYSYSTACSRRLFPQYRSSGTRLMHRSNYSITARCWRTRRRRGRAFWRL